MERACFNPLHCGAVVASKEVEARREAEARFNPLHCGAVVASRGAPSMMGPPAACFNPLHCGAVVASHRAHLRVPDCRHVSIPFIAGQWSLHRNAPPYACVRAGFNPLHCGAVVAS